MYGISHRTAGARHIIRCYRPHVRSLADSGPNSGRPGQDTSAKPTSDAPARRVANSFAGFSIPSREEIQKRSPLRSFVPSDQAANYRPNLNYLKNAQSENKASFASRLASMQPENGGASSASSKKQTNALPQSLGNNQPQRPPSNTRGNTSQPPRQNRNSSSQSRGAYNNNQKIASQRGRPGPLPAGERAPRKFEPRSNTNKEGFRTGSPRPDGPPRSFSGSRPTSKPFAGRPQQSGMGGPFGRGGVYAARGAERGRGNRGRGRGNAKPRRQLADSDAKWSSEQQSVPLLDIDLPELPATPDLDTFSAFSKAQDATMAEKTALTNNSRLMLELQGGDYSRYAPSPGETNSHDRKLQSIGRAQLTVGQRRDINLPYRTRLVTLVKQSVGLANSKVKDAF